MLQPLILRFGSGVRFDSGARFDSNADAPAAILLTPATPFNRSTAMEYWEITKQRAQDTLPVWTQHLPALKIGTLGSTDLAALIAGFEPLVQARTDAQDTFDAAFRAAQDALARMKVLGTKVPAIIEGQLDENTALMKDLDDVYATTPRAEGSILKRLRDLLPVWARANTALAALTPAQPPITRSVGGMVYTVALARTLLDGYTDLINTQSDRQGRLNGARAALRSHDRAADQLCKKWYKVVKGTADPGTDLADALSGITTEPGTPAPDTVEISTIQQGGETGLQVLVAYVPGGGDHATTQLIQWQVVGVDAAFTHSAPLDPSGNALGPFAQGQVVKIITEVSNSSATRTTAPRTITLGEPVV